jgi:hypothetical protein
MTAKRELVTIHFIGGYSRYHRGHRIRYRLRLKGLIGKKASQAINIVSDEFQSAVYPPFFLNGEKVRRNSARLLIAGDVLEVYGKK